MFGFLKGVVYGLLGDGKTNSKHNEAVRKITAAHDMVSHPDESYYASQYLYWIRPECEERFPERNPAILDIGCGQGRLSLALADWAKFGKVIGVDFTPQAIEKARQYAKARGIGNVEFHEDDALAYIQTLPNESFQIALMTEVAFFLPSYREVIEEINRVLSPDGLAFISFWTKYYRLLQMVKTRSWEGAERILNNPEGMLRRNPVWLSWHDVDDIRVLLTTVGFDNVKFRGVGVCSGIEGDPLALIARPSLLSEEERQNLMKIETTLGKDYADCGRYILAIAGKRGGTS